MSEALNNFLKLLESPAIAAVGAWLVAQRNQKRPNENLKGIIENRMALAAISPTAKSSIDAIEKLDTLIFLEVEKQIAKSTGEEPSFFQKIRSRLPFANTDKSNPSWWVKILFCVLAAIIVFFIAWSPTGASLLDGSLKIIWSNEGIRNYIPSFLTFVLFYFALTITSRNGKKKTMKLVEEVESVREEVGSVREEVKKNKINLVDNKDGTMTIDYEDTELPESSE